MNFEINTEVKIDGNLFYVIDKITYDNKKYIYTQKVENDEFSDEYFVYEISDKPTLVEDYNILKIVLEKFIKNINDELETGD